MANDQFALPPRPDFTPADIRGNLAEARTLRTIGSGQPIKASWLCHETLEIYHRHHLLPDLDLVDALRVLTLTYTDAIKRGEVVYSGAAEDSIAELAALGGIPQAPMLHRLAQGSSGPDAAAAGLRAFSVRAPEGAAAASSKTLPVHSPRIGFLLAEISPGELPYRLDTHGCTRLTEAEIRIVPPVRAQARFECLYLNGLVGMAQALRVERSGAGATSASQLQSELAFLVDSAWWFHLAGLVAGDAPVDPEECYRLARAKLSMLIRRIAAGRHFEMPMLEYFDSLE